MKLKRFLAMLLAVVMIVGMLPANVFATEAAEVETSVIEAVDGVVTLTDGMDGVISIPTGEEVRFEYTPADESAYAMYMFSFNYDGVSWRCDEENDYVIEEWSEDGRQYMLSDLTYGHTFSRTLVNSSSVTETVRIRFQNATAGDPQICLEKSEYYIYPNYSFYVKAFYTDPMNYDGYQFSLEFPDGDDGCVKMSYSGLNQVKLTGVSGGTAILRVTSDSGKSATATIHCMPPVQLVDPYSNTEMAPAQGRVALQYSAPEDGWYIVRHDSLEQITSHGYGYWYIEKEVEEDGWRTFYAKLRAGDSSYLHLYNSTDEHAYPNVIFQKAEPVTEMYLQAETQVLLPGDELNISAVFPNVWEFDDVTWEISDPNLLHTYTTTGLTANVTALEGVEGVCTVTATAASGVSVSMDVEVVQPIEIGVEITESPFDQELTLEAGERVYFRLNAPAYGYYVITHDDRVNLCEYEDVHSTYHDGIHYAHTSCYGGEKNDFYLENNSGEPQTVHVTLQKAGEFCGVDFPYSTPTVLELGQTYSIDFEFSDLYAFDPVHTVACSDYGMVEINDYGTGMNIRGLEPGTVTVYIQNNTTSTSHTFTIKGPVEIQEDFAQSYYMQKFSRETFLFTPATSGKYVLGLNNSRINLDVADLSSLMVDSVVRNVDDSVYYCVELEGGVTYKIRLFNWNDEGEGVYFRLMANPVVDQVTIDAEQISDYVGAIRELNVSVSPEYAFTDVIWSSNDENIVSIEECYDNTCRLLLKNCGEAVVTATVGDVEVTCDVTVKELQSLQLGVNQIEVSADSDLFYTFTPTESGNYYFTFVEAQYDVNMGVLQDGWNFVPICGTTCFNDTMLGYEWMEEEGYEKRYYHLPLEAGTSYSLFVHNYGSEDASFQLTFERSQLPNRVDELSQDRIAVGDRIPFTFWGMEPTAAAEYTVQLSDDTLAEVSIQNPRGFFLKGLADGTVTVTVQMNMADGTVTTLTLDVPIDGPDGTIEPGQSVTVTVQPNDVYILEFIPEENTSGTYYFVTETPDGVDPDMVGGWNNSYDYYDTRILTRWYNSDWNDRHMLRLHNHTDEPVTATMQLLMETSQLNGMMMPATLEVREGETLNLQAITDPVSSNQLNYVNWTSSDTSILSLVRYWTNGPVAQVRVYGEKAGTVTLTGTAYSYSGESFTVSCEVTVKGMEQFPIGETVTVEYDSANADMIRYAVTPETSGYYNLIYSDNDLHTYLRGENDRYIDYRSSTYNGMRCWTYYLEAGTTYTMYTYSYYDSHTYEVTLKLSSTPTQLHVYESSTVILNNEGYVGYEFGAWGEFGELSCVVEDPEVVQVTGQDIHNILLYGLKPGSTTVTVTCGELSAVAEVEVLAPSGALTMGENPITVPANSMVCYTFTPEEEAQYTFLLPDAQENLYMDILHEGIWTRHQDGFRVLNSYNQLSADYQYIITIMNAGDEDCEDILSVSVAAPVESIAIADVEGQENSQARVHINILPITAPGLEVWDFSYEIEDPSMVEFWGYYPNEGYMELYLLKEGSTTIHFTFTTPESVYEADVDVTITGAPSLPLGETFDLAIPVYQEKTVKLSVEESGMYYILSSVYMELGVRQNGEHLASNHYGAEEGLYMKVYLESGVDYRLHLYNWNEYDVVTQLLLDKTTPPTEMNISDSVSMAHNAPYQLYYEYERPTQFQIPTVTVEDDEIVMVEHVDNERIYLVGLKPGETTLTVAAGEVTRKVEVTVNALSGELEVGENLISIGRNEEQYYAFTPATTDYYVFSIADPDQELWLEHMNLHFACGWQDGKTVLRSYEQLEAGHTYVLYIWNNGQQKMDAVLTASNALEPESFTFQDVTVQQSDYGFAWMDMQPLEGKIPYFWDYRLYADDESIVSTQGFEEGCYIVVRGQKPGETTVHMQYRLEGEEEYRETSFKVTVTALPDLVLGEEITLKTSSGTVLTYRFTPETSGHYYIRVDNGIGVDIYADNTSVMQNSSSDGEYNYRTFYMEAGTTYSFDINSYGLDGRFSFLLDHAKTPDDIDISSEAELLVGQLSNYWYGLSGYGVYAELTYTIADESIVKIVEVGDSYVTLEGLKEGTTSIVFFAGNAVKKMDVTVTGADIILAEGSNTVDLVKNQVYSLAFAPQADGDYVVCMPNAEGRGIYLVNEMENVRIEGETHFSLYLHGLKAGQTYMIEIYNMADTEKAVNIEVLKPVALEGIAVGSYNDTVYVNNTAEFYLSLKPYNAMLPENEQVQWSVDDEEVLRIEGSGNTSAFFVSQKAGTAKVTATVTLAEDQVFTASYTVTVEDIPVLTLDSPVTIQAEVNGYYTYNFTPTESGLYTLSSTDFDGYIGINGGDQTGETEGDGMRYAHAMLTAGQTYRIHIETRDAETLNIMIAKSKTPESMSVKYSQIVKNPNSFFDLYVDFNAGCMETVNWTVSDTDVVFINYVDLGYVSLGAAEEGTAVITGTTPSGLSVSVTVVVDASAQVGPQIHQIFDSSITGAIGQKVQLEIIATGEDLEYTWYLMNPMIGYPEVIQQGSSNVLELTLTEDIAGYYINCTIKDAYGEAVNDGWAEIILNGRTVVDQGTCGETMTWVLLDDGSLEISGLGDMYDYDPSTGNDAPWNAYSKQITCVRMEDLVHIGDNAFCDLGLLEVVEIPLSVESIGTNAFAAGLAIEVRYAGTETHWSHVAGRETLAGCQITYCYGAPDLWDSLVEISEDNYVLVEDVIALASDLELPAGATLDLRGKSMSISNLVSFGSIIDTVGGGILQAQDYVFGQNGAYMPIYDAEVDGYQFFNWDLESLGTRTNAEGVTFGTALVFENAQAYELLLQGNTGLRVSVKLSWEGGEQTFVFSDEMLGNYADLQMRYCDLVAALMLTVTGVDALESGAQLTVTPSVSAADGQWSATGLAMTYTKA